MAIQNNPNSFPCYSSRCVLHAVFAQQSYTNLRPGQRISLAARKVSWSLPGRGNRVRPTNTERKVTVVTMEEEKKEEKKVMEEEEVGEEVSGPKQLKRKNTLTPRPPCYGMSGPTSTPQVGRRATIPNIPNITIDKTSSV